ncbi:unnamed protein product [Rotaria magnacalcarata]|uniref:N-acetylphosphatidylethanolamine-hydrolyzing phospholipase D n=1 Tax=Rotaria magnacalcarata TaxID=392030 RepID=A0A816PFT6_9BILA|nr:unnamed protein product [Rotaria magnacalcarata]CAF4077878.1 unnamed protein product [Rotaria magnacalcarata]
MGTSSSMVTTENVVSDEVFVKSRIENNRYINSFNPEFKMPGFGAVLRWKIGDPNNTNLPADLERLDETLPVLKPKPDELLKTSPGLRFVWIGHASCLVQMDDFLFLTDPVFSDRCGITSSIGPKRFRPPALTVDDLPENLDAIVISHNHYDHLDYPSVQNLNARYGNRLTWFCGQGGREWFLDCHVENVIELEWWEECQHPKKEHVKIAFCPAQHWSRRTAFDLNKALWGGYAIWNKNHKFYFAGDTGYTHNIPIFRQIGTRYGPFDLSAIPIGAYEPRWMMEAQHVSPDEAVKIHIDIKSRKSIGIHWATWALANEYYLEPKEKLLKAMENNKLDLKSFSVVKHGEIIDLP